MILAKLDKLSSREKAGLSASLLLLFAAAVDNFAARPIVRALRDLDVQIEVERNRLTYNHGALRWEAAAAQQYGQIRERLGVASSSAEAIADLKGQVDGLARKHGVSILKMDHREPKPGDGCEEYLVDVGAFEADIRSLIRFVQDVWQSPGMMRVVKLNLTPGSGKDMVKGSMSVTRLMMKEAPLAGAPAEQAASSTGK